MTSQTLTQGEIISILKPYFPREQYDENVLSYISNMIYTDMPENETDLKFLIGDYLDDGNKYIESSKTKILKEINTLLHKNGVKGARKAIIAEKLEDPTRLCDIQVGSNNTITSLNFDPLSLTFNVEKLYAKGMIQGNAKITEFYIDPSKKKAMEEYLEEMRRQKELSEDYSIHHIKDESHKVDINVPSFTIHIGGKTLLNEAELKISFGRRYVLIGRNGIGKTTLLNHIVRKEIDGIPKQLQIVHVEQEAIMSENKLIDEILLCDRERTKLLNESNEINEKILNEKNEEKIKNLTNKLVEINNRLEEIDASSAENKAKFILLGLGFHESDFNKKTKNFSGGWRMRISLAKALYVMPDLLLLDEPTNHLDMNAVMWLEDYLLNWPYTLVIVSHAKDFIDSIATDIIHLQNQKLTYYKGNYTDFDKARTEQLKLNKRLHEAQTKKIEHMQEFINKFRYKAKRANLVQSRIKQMNKMELVEEILEDPMSIFVFPEPEKISPPVLRLDNADLGYDNNIIIEKVNLNVDMTSRIALVGANGCGKTTLLKGLNGDINPISGLCFKHSKLRLSVFAQHHVDQLDLELSPLEQLQKYYPDTDINVIRSQLSSFGISGNVALRPNYLLSGGQKSRVALSLIVMNNPQIILMDEPTNHLDLDAINALSIALNSYEGGLLIISHDQNFVERVCNQIYMIENKKCKQFRGNFNDYRRYLRIQTEKNGGKINF
jgi:ATP-binding cassette subfamily F protein 3